MGLDSLRGRRRNRRRKRLTNRPRKGATLEDYMTIFNLIEAGLITMSAALIASLFGLMFGTFFDHSDAVVMSGYGFAIFGFAYVVLILALMLSA